MSRRSAVLGLLGAASLTGCASTPALPEDLGEYEWTYKNMKHPRLWQPSAGGGFKQRLRLVVTPFLLRFKFSVSIDQDLQGHATGKYVRYHRGKGIITEEYRFHVAADDMARLDEIVARKTILQDPREFWRHTGDEDGDQVCIDGVEVILERATADGYSFSDANVSCAVTRDFYEFAEAMAHAAGRSVEEAFDSLM